MATKHWMILGPTASGKTKLACQLAYQLNAEILSADSRQVYKGMDIGTGKDLHEYVVQGKQIPYHLIDICQAPERLHIVQFREAAEKVLLEAEQRDKIIIVCGGSGLYLESLLKPMPYAQVPINPSLRLQLQEESKELLQQRYLAAPIEGFTADLSSHKRLVRALEIKAYLNEHPFEPIVMKERHFRVIGIDVDRETRRDRISKRLQYRLENGLVEEVQQLLNQGISHADLQYYGLEYKFVSEYLEGKFSREELYTRLEAAIHQFAKRQMTYFRKMEKEGLPIQWIKQPEEFILTEE